MSDATVRRAARAVRTDARACRDCASTPVRCEETAMLSTEKGDDRARSFVTRVLLVLHGAEPAGWPTEACRVLSTWRNPSVRVLVVPIVPFPSFTSMLPAARRRYAGARRAWHQQEEARILVALDRILPGLPRSVEVTRARWSDTDCIEMIDQHARDCSADVVVIRSEEHTSELQSQSNL